MIISRIHEYWIQESLKTAIENHHGKNDSNIVRNITAKVSSKKQISFIKPESL
jgi:hypothetical protein